MNGLLPSLLTASLMMSIASVIVAICLGRFRNITPAMRQCLFACLLFQGLMLYRVPVELPWLEAASSPRSLTPPINRNALPMTPQATELSAAIASGKARASAATTSPVSASSSAAGTANASPSRLLLSAAAVIWISGLVLIIARGLLGYQRVCSQIADLPAADEQTSAAWKRLCEAESIPVPPMLISAAAGPMLVRRPTGYALVVPEAFWHSLTDRQQRGVLLHELAHLRRRDVWRQLMIRAAAAVHWWNPVSWWCVRRFEESIEWACDATLARRDPAAAHGLAGGLVALAEFAERGGSISVSARPGVGIQSMAAPPLTQRVTRLLAGPTEGDSKMKRSMMGVMILTLVTLSAFQFRLVAANPEDTNTGEAENGAADSTPSLQVLQRETAAQVHALSSRLNPDDPTTARLKSLLETEGGKMAFAGLISDLRTRYRIDARGEAVPSFIERHFAKDDEGKLTLRPDSEAIADGWLKQADDLEQTLAQMKLSLQTLADRIDGVAEADQMAKRLLNDPEAGFAIVLDEFDGRANPIDLYIGKAMERILVKRGNRWIVIPTLPKDARRQIARFELAAEVFDNLRTELPSFVNEFAPVDERHTKLIKACQNPTMAAVVALHMSDGASGSATATADRLFDQLEQITRDTPKGLVITEEKAWETLATLTDTAERVEKRQGDVQTRLLSLAGQLDESDEMTKRFAKALRSGLVAYQLAADIPYADLDLAKQVNNLLSQAMEPAGEGKLRIRQESAEEVQRRAAEILAACRTIRRYLSRVEQFRQKMADRQLAADLEGAGVKVLLSEIRRSAEQSATPSLGTLTAKLFKDAPDDEWLTIRPEHRQLVDELARRASEVETELGKDDF